MHWVFSVLPWTVETSVTFAPSLGGRTGERHGSLHQGQAKSTADQGKALPADKESRRPHLGARGPRAAF